MKAGSGGQSTGEAVLQPGRRDRDEGMRQRPGRKKSPWAGRAAGEERGDGEWPRGHRMRIVNKMHS